MKRKSSLIGGLAGLILGGGIGCGLNLFPNSYIEDRDNLPNRIEVHEDDAAQTGGTKVLEYTITSDTNKPVGHFITQPDGRPYPFNLVSVCDILDGGTREECDLYVVDNDVPINTGDEFPVRLSPAVNNVRFVGDYVFDNNGVIGASVIAGVGHTFDVSYVAGPSEPVLQDQIDELGEDVGVLQDIVGIEGEGGLDDEAGSDLIRCYNVVDCDDGNPNTIDTCNAAGTTSSSCSYSNVNPVNNPISPPPFVPPIKLLFLFMYILHRHTHFQIHS